MLNKMQTKSNLNPQKLKSTLKLGVLIVTQIFMSKLDVHIVYFYNHIPRLYNKKVYS